MANNVLIYNGIIQGATGGLHERWLTNTQSASYIDIRNTIVALATAVDALIPIGEITTADGNLMQSIAQGVFAGRYLVASNDISSIAQAMVALWTQLRAQFLVGSTFEFNEDFQGVLDNAGTLTLAGWTAVNTPVISQRDTGAAHTANNPGQLNLNLDGAAADNSAIFYGPFDFGTVASIRANVLIPSAGGNELANCAFGWGLVSDPTALNTVASQGVWTSNQIVNQVRSSGAGPGVWMTRASNGAVAATTFNGPTVVLDTWYEIEITQTAPGSGTWAYKANGLVSPFSRPLAPPSGICYFALGGLRTAAAAGRNITMDAIKIATFPLARYIPITSF